MTSIRTSVLFAERFLTDLKETGGVSLARYDEELGYSLGSDGQPFVDSGVAGETRTASEVQAERDDADDDVKTRTTTFVQAEADDWEAFAIQTRTETAVRAEHPDYDTWAGTSTMTKVQNEAEDRD